MRCAEANMISKVHINTLLTTHCPDTKKCKPSCQRICSCVCTSIPYFLGAFAKLRRATASSVMSIRLSACLDDTTGLLLDEFSWNFILEACIEIRRENSTFVDKSDKNNRPFTWRL